MPETLGTDGEYLQATLKANVDNSKKLQKISCKTFNRQSFFT